MQLQFANIIRLEPGHKVPMHSHEALEVVYFVAGQGKTKLAGKEYEIRPGFFTINPVGKLHDQQNETSVTSWCLGIVNSGLEKMAGGWRDVAGEIGYNIRQLLDELEQQNSQHKLICDGLLRLIVGQILRIGATTEPKPKQSKETLFTKALQVIEQQEGRLSVADLSEILFISSDYMRHLFREHSDQSPMRHIIEARLTKAQNLLTQTKLAINEIALQCGFENPYYFSRLFKQVTGKTPSVYRRNEKCK